MVRVKSQNKSQRSAAGGGECGLNVNFASIIKSESDFDDKYNLTKTLSEQSFSNYHVQDFDDVINFDGFQSPGKVSPRNKLFTDLQHQMQCTKHIEETITRRKDHTRNCKMIGQQSTQKKVRQKWRVNAK